MQIAEEKVELSSVSAGGCREDERRRVVVDVVGGCVAFGMNEWTNFHQGLKQTSVLHNVAERGGEKLLIYN